MSVPTTPKHRARVPRPANDNQPKEALLRAMVLIPEDFPVTQAEIEVFAALLDDWEALAANDNKEPEQ